MIRNIISLLIWIVYPRLSLCMLANRGTKLLIFLGNIVEPNVPYKHWEILGSVLAGDFGRYPTLNSLHMTALWPTCAVSCLEHLVGLNARFPIGRSFAPTPRSTAAS
ncbi:hypothetical protein B0T10DRAFT_495002 [Thelonectria olida]|uniref:Secreted protein n=1 Tax=Thelonectria olida TaxID=1576542 RepID=A0A9P8VXC1_9HYPO|nr:hypothetical protein B0T10DRAFT_495002 [Thelonectria olida]